MKKNSGTKKNQGRTVILPGANKSKIKKNEEIKLIFLDFQLFFNFFCVLVLTLNSQENGRGDPSSKKPNLFNDEKHTKIRKLSRPNLSYRP